MARGILCQPGLQRDDLWQSDQPRWRSLHEHARGGTRQCRRRRNQQRHVRCGLCFPGPDQHALRHDPDDQHGQRERLRLQRSVHLDGSERQLDELRQLGCKRRDSGSRRGAQRERHGDLQCGRFGNGDTQHERDTLLAHLLECLRSLHGRRHRYGHPTDGRPSQ